MTDEQLSKIEARASRLAPGLAPDERLRNVLACDVPALVGAVRERNATVARLRAMATVWLADEDGTPYAEGVCDAARAMLEALDEFAEATRRTSPSD